MRNTFLVGAVAAVLVSPLPSQAAGQNSNPLSNILGTLQKIAAGSDAAQKENKALQPGQESSPGGAQTDDILRSVAMGNGANGSAAGCSYYMMQDDKILLAQKTGKYTDAGIRAKLQAAQVAACALAGHGPAIPQAKNDVGTLLAISVLNLHKGGMVTEDTVLEAKYSISLLKLNEGANQALISEIEQTFWPKGPTANSQAFAAMSGKEVATKYQENTFAFKRTYNGKTLQIKGRAQKITGTETSAMISIEGIKRDTNEQGWQDIVLCKIKDKTAMDDAARISKGDTISVQGIVTPGLLPGVVLEDCRLVR